METSRAQIVATIGPATRDVDILEKMMRGGMDVTRLNFSHGTYEEHAEYIQLIRDAAEKAGKTVPILQDLSGPRKKTEEGHEFSGEAEVITEKDKKDLEFGITQKVDYVVMSYVVDENDINELKKLIADGGGNQKVVAKVERSEAVENIDGLIEASDAIMIGRGDLGQSIPLEKVPFVQLEIVKKCNEARKPVITATHMLLSMTENETPTRAEVSDVANAILNGSDAVMLSEETAIGKHPLKVIEIMEKIVSESEKHLKVKFNLL
jgi:pyruvate kinase